MWRNSKAAALMGFDNHAGARLPPPATGTSRLAMKQFPPSRAQTFEPAVPQGMHGLLRAGL
jgi:hypothetical protein